MLSSAVKIPSQSHLINFVNEVVANPTVKKISIFALGISAGVASSFMKENPISGFGGALIGGMLGLGASCFVGKNEKPLKAVSSIQVGNFESVTNSVSVNPTVKKISAFAFGVLAGMASSFLEENPFTGFACALVGGVLSLGVASFVQGSESVEVVSSEQGKDKSDLSVLKSPTVTEGLVAGLNKETEGDEYSVSGNTHYDGSEKSSHQEDEVGSLQDDFSMLVDNLSSVPSGVQLSSVDEVSLTVANLFKLSIQQNSRENPSSRKDSPNGSVHSRHGDKGLEHSKRKELDLEEIAEQRGANDSDQVDEGSSLLIKREMDGVSGGGNDEKSSLLGGGGASQVNVSSKTPIRDLLLGLSRAASNGANDVYQAGMKGMRSFSFRNLSSSET